MAITLVTSIDRLLKNRALRTARIRTVLKTDRRNEKTGVLVQRINSADRRCRTHIIDIQHNQQKTDKRVMITIDNKKETVLLVTINLLLMNVFILV